VRIDHDGAEMQIVSHRGNAGPDRERDQRGIFLAAAR
jgi:hypothetical protein